MESDFLVTVKFVNEDGDEEAYPKHILIDDWKELKSKINDVLVHILREAKRYTDVLTKMGVEKNEKVIKILVPPNKMVKEMMCDFRGVIYGRGT